MRKHLLCTGTLTLAALAVAGCAETDPNEINNTVTTGQMEPVKPLPAAANAPAPAPYPGKDAKSAPTETPAATAEVTLSSEELAEIAKLPEDEQPIAKAQKVCPVSNQNLGSMGMPVKVEHDGDIAFLCCKGCMADFEKDPVGTIAKAKK